MQVDVRSIVGPLSAGTYHLQFGPDGLIGAVKVDDESRLANCIVVSQAPPGQALMLAGKTMKDVVMFSVNLPKEPIKAIQGVGVVTDGKGQILPYDDKPK